MTKQIKTTWHDLPKINPLAAEPSEYRIAPWSLPTPPEGRQWHRTDWTEDMLPEGWRPLLDGETTQEGDECRWDCNKESWHTSITHEAKRGKDWTAHHFRTRRPLPTPSKLYLVSEDGGETWKKTKEVK